MTTAQIIELDGSQAIRLPDEDSRVYVVVPAAAGSAAATIRSPWLVQPSQAADFAKEIVEVTDDARL